MKRFSFKLETVLRHRKNIEEQEATKFARISGDLQREEEHLRKLEIRAEASRNDLRAARSNLQDTEEVSRIGLYLNRLARDMEASNQRLGKLRLEHRAQREALVEAAKKKQVLDTMKAKTHKSFIQEQERLQQKMIDEIVITRFVHKES